MATAGPQDRRLKAIDLLEAKVAVERDRGLVVDPDVEVHPADARVTKVRKLPLDQVPAVVPTSHPRQQVDMQVRRILVHDGVRHSRWRMEQPDDLRVGPGVAGEVGRRVIRDGLLLAKRGPPFRLRPGLECTAVRRGQAIAGDSPGVGDDERQVRLPDDAGPHVHVPQQVRVAE
jgi:hypothetical protein